MLIQKEKRRHKESTYVGISVILLNIIWTTANIDFSWVVNGNIVKIILFGWWRLKALKIFTLIGDYFHLLWEAT